MWMCVFRYDRLAMFRPETKPVYGLGHPEGTCALMENNAMLSATCLSLYGDVVLTRGLEGGAPWYSYPQASARFLV